MKSRARVVLPWSLAIALAVGAPALAVADPVPPEDPSSVEVSLSDSPVHPGQRVTLSGKVRPAAAGYEVTVERMRPEGWKEMATLVTDDRGTFSTRVSGGYFSTHRFRVNAVNPVESSETPDPAVTASAALKVVPSYRPKGRKGQHSFLMGPDSRWDPCGPISYRVRTKGGYKGSLKDVKRAFAHVAQATGFEFVYQGRTKVVAWHKKNKRGLERDPRADLTFSWGTPKQVPGLRGGVLGLGGAGGWSMPGGGVHYEYAGVVLDATDKRRLVPGFKKSKRKPAWGAVMVHEIGHAMGLDHTGGRAQVMFPSVRPGSEHRLQKGDLAGLASVGADRGCVASAARAALRGGGQEPRITSWVDRIH